MISHGADHGEEVCTRLHQRRAILGVMPPMAQHGSSISSDHHCRMSGSIKRVTSLVPEGKNAPKAT